MCVTAQIGSFVWKGVAMANYDASIRVNTEVDNSDVGQLQKEFDRLSAKLEQCYEKGEKLEALGIDKQSRQWKSLVYDTAQYEAKLADVTERLQQVGGIKPEAASEGFEQAEKSGKKCLKSIQSDTKKSNGLFATMGTRLKGIALSLLVFNWISKGFNAMVSAMKEGFQNLAQYSTEYNEHMSALKSSMAETKNALAAAFEPVINSIIPCITRMIQWLNIAIDTIGQFFAALKGSNTYTKASKQAIDYGKSLDAASKAAKRALASFDELNVVSENGGGGGSAGGEKKGADAFETGEVESKIAKAVNRIKALIKPFIDSITKWWSKLNFTPLLNSLRDLQVACEPFLGYIYDGLLFFLEEILLPMGEWVIEDGLPAFIELVAAGFELLASAAEALSPGLSYIWENVLKPMGEYTGNLFVQAIDAIKNAVSQLAQLLSSKSEEISAILTTLGRQAEILWTLGFKPALDFIIGGFEELLGSVDDIFGDIIDICNGFNEFLEGVFTLDFNKALSGLTDIMKGIFNGIIDIYETVVNTIISGLNKISVTVPGWIPGIGGEKFGFNLQKLQLPRLANGAVIQGGQPFAAILGDQRFGQTNIEAPLQTIVDALKQALAETGGNTGGQYTFVAQLDGEVIFRETVRQNDIFKKSTGSSAYA